MQVGDGGKKPDKGSMLYVGGGIYPNNCNAQQTVQKTQSSNWISFKKYYFEAYQNKLASRLHLK